LAIIVYVLYEMDRAAKILGACWIAIGAVVLSCAHAPLEKAGSALEI